MSRYRLEIRPSVEKTLRKIRDAKLQRRLDDAFNKLWKIPVAWERRKWLDFKIVTAFALEKSMKEWRIYYKLGRSLTSQGWDSKDDAIRFMAKTPKAGDAIKDIKWRGQNIPAKVTLSMLADAERIKKQM
jgi:hypothetical protein